MKLIVSISVVWVAACGGTSTPTPTTPPPTDPGSGSAATPPPTATAATGAGCEVNGGTPADVECALTTMDFYATKVCACATADCANAATTDMSTWMKSTDPKLGDVKPTPEQEQRMETISTRFEGCMGKLVGTDPAASE